MTEELGVESEAVANPKVDSDNLGEVPSEYGNIVFMMAATKDANQRPELADFAQVKPRNLSATSVTFYCDSAPASDSIVLLMGKLDEDPIYASANVTSCSEGFWERKRRYLVGCELTSRL